MLNDTKILYRKLNKDANITKDEKGSLVIYTTEDIRLIKGAVNIIKTGLVIDYKAELMRPSLSTIMAKQGVMITGCGEDENGQLLVYIINLYDNDINIFKYGELCKITFVNIYQANPILIKEGD